MPCIPLINHRKKVVGFVCGFHPVYDFRGFLFEVHNYFGPVPLRRDNHSARVTIPSGFWRAWEAFEKLSAEEREKYRWIEADEPDGANDV